MNGPPLDPQRSPSERFALIVTNLVRLGGLVVAMNEALIEPVIRPGAIAIAALMMAGAQSLETFLGSFFGGGKGP
jgi:hypothetical protein